MENNDSGVWIVLQLNTSVSAPLGTRPKMTVHFFNIVLTFEGRLYCSFLCTAGIVGAIFHIQNDTTMS